MNWGLEGEGRINTSSGRKKDSAVQAKVHNFQVTFQALTEDLSTGHVKMKRPFMQ